jgi:hypothetical protein
MKMSMLPEVFSGALMGQGDDVAALKGARYVVSSTGAKIVKPPIYATQRSRCPRPPEAYCPLFGEGDDMAALENAKYVAPTGANIIEASNPTLLKNPDVRKRLEVSRISLGGDDMKHMLSTVPAMQLHGSRKYRQTSDPLYSRIRCPGLPGSTVLSFGEGDDMSALENARYTAPRGAKIAARLFYVVVVFGSRMTTQVRANEANVRTRQGLLGSLMGQGDDMAA